MSRYGFRWFLLLMIHLSLIAPGLLAQNQQWLQYGVTREAGEKIGWENVTFVTAPIEKTPPKDLKTGKFIAADPLFAKWLTPLAKSGWVWLVLDRSKPTVPYDLLIVDSDLDGDLTDETPYKPFEAQQYNKDYYQASFSPIKVVLPTDEGPITYHFRLLLHMNSNQPNVNVSSACFYEGRAMIGGKPRQCALVDSNANGTFNDTADDFGKIDRILIDKGPAWETRFVGQYIEIDGKYYHPQPARDGAFITFDLCDKLVMGEVRVPEMVTQIRVGGLNGLLDIHHTKGVGKLPVGKYRVYDWEIERKDKNGIAWKLAGQSFPNSVALDVTRDKPATLDIGEPMVSSLQMTREATQFSFNQGLKGKLGERITFQCNGNQPPAPKIRITNKDGSFNKTYSLEYG